MRHQQLGGDSITRYRAITDEDDDDDLGTKKFPVSSSSAATKPPEIQNLEKYDKKKIPNHPSFHNMTKTWIKSKLNQGVEDVMLYP